MKLYNIYSGQELKIAEKILQRRYQMLVHSYLYYELNNNIIDDSTWSKWGKELQNLQKQYPEISVTIEWSDAFKNWDASTGAFLPYKDPKIIKIASSLIKKQDIRLQSRQGRLF